MHLDTPSLKLIYVADILWCWASCRTIFVRHWFIVLFALSATVDVPSHSGFYLIEFSLPSICSFWIFLAFLIPFKFCWSRFYSITNIRLISHCWIYMEGERCKSHTLEKLFYCYYTQSHENKMHINLDIGEV